MYGARKEETKVCRGATTQVCRIYEPESNNICDPVVQRTIPQRQTGEGC